MCLSASDFLRFTEVLEVLVVCTDFDNMLCSKKEWSAALKSEDNTGKLFVMRIIVLFSWEEAAGVEGDWVESIFEFLHKDGT